MIDKVAEPRTLLSSEPEQVAAREQTHSLTQGVEHLLRGKDCPLTTATKLFQERYFPVIHQPVRPDGDPIFFAPLRSSFRRKSGY